MILAILQARMSSTRLPGKVLKPVLERPMLFRQIDRLRRARRIDRLVVATSNQASDDPVASACAAEGVDCYRGDLNDVLARFHGAAEKFGPAEHVVRLTADCPLADAQIIDDTIDLHIASGADYTSNSLDRTYPDGLDVEVMTIAALDAAFREATAQAQREHVTPFIHQNPQRFRIRQMTQSDNLGDLRWTVDTPADFDFVVKVFEALLPSQAYFDQADILDLMRRQPELAAINGQRIP